jgi:hypothetical protein
LVITVSTPSDFLSYLRHLHDTEPFYQGNVLQTGFQEGMEFLLGVKEDQKYGKQLETFYKYQTEAIEDATRRDVHEADTLEEDEKRDTLRQRYQRMYWETVPESGGVRVIWHFLSLLVDPYH